VFSAALLRWGIECWEVRRHNTARVDDLRFLLMTAEGSFGGVVVIFRIHSFIQFTCDQVEQLSNTMMVFPSCPSYFQGVRQTDIRMRACVIDHLASESPPLEAHTTLSNGEIALYSAFHVVR
jgi:hypothetical protein